jgi:hypothetical protein
MSTVKNNKALQSQSTPAYTDMIKASKEAFLSDSTTQNKYVKASGLVAKFYKTPEDFKAGRKQYEADAIIPTLSKQLQSWLKINVKDTDKDSPEGKQARKNIATARGFVASYFTKISGYAFPVVKEDTEATKREPSLAVIEDAIKLAKKLQKLENAPFNLVKVTGFMNLILKEMNVTSETNEADEV